jgi:folate-binding protein YgfZ
MTKVNSDMMQADWQKSLEAQGALVSGDAVVHFGNAAAELTATSNNNTLCDLSHLGLLQLSGDDAASFLQGQVTNDVNLLSGNNAHYSAYCNPKGRMLALFLAFSNNNHLHLQFNKTLLETISKRLKMYVMRSKVTIKDMSDEVIKLGVNGPDVQKLLTPLFASLPSKNYELITLENTTLLKLPSIDGHTRFEIITDTASAFKTWDALKQQCQPIGKSCWDWLDIQTGIPDISLNTQEQFVPQMLNLDILDGINFKKGCYTGQEIVARMHYLGSVKRRTFLASLQSSAAPQAGEVLLDEKNQAAGQIVRVATNLNNGFDVLAEMRLEAKGVHWNNATLSIKTLPYTIEKE